MTAITKKVLAHRRSRSKVATHEYAWADGYHAKIKADVAGPAIRRIELRHGHAHPEVIVEEARDKKHPLHPQFLWDDTRAAHNFRLEQARRMLRSIRIVEYTVEGKREEQLAYANIMVGRVELTDHGEGLDGDGATLSTYMPVSVVVTNPDFCNQVLKQALSYMRGLRKRYQFVKAAAKALGALAKAELVIERAIDRKAPLNGNRSRGKARSTKK